MQPSTVRASQEIAANPLPTVPAPESGTLLQVILNHLPQSVYWKDCDGRFLGCNQAFARSLGLAAETEILGKTTAELAPLGGDLSALLERDLQPLEQELPDHFITTQPVPNSAAQTWLDVYTTPLQSAQGTPLGILATATDITHWKQMEQQLQARDRLLEGVAAATHCLLTLPDYDQSIQAALAVLGAAAEVDRVYIFENHDHPITEEPLMSQRWEWTADGVSPEINNAQLQNLSYKTSFPRWYEVFSLGHLIAGLVADLPDSERAILEPQGIRSILVMPIEIDQTLWGLIGFDDCHRDRPWSDSEKSILRAAVGSLGGAIARHRMETELRQSKQLLQRVIDTIPQAIFWKDHHSVYLGCNQNFADLIGVETPAQVIGKTDYHLPRSIEEADRVRASDRQILDTSTPETGKIESRPLSDGQPGWWEINKTPLHDRDGRVIGILGTLQNITRRRQAEAALRQSEARFQKVSANVPGMLYQVVRYGNGALFFPFISSGCRDLLELPPEKLGGNASLLLNRLHPGDRDAFQQSLDQSAASLQPWRWEGRFLLPLGKVKWVEGIARPERRVDGSIAWDGFLMDVTRRKQAEESLQKAYGELERRVAERTLELEKALQELKQTQTQMIQSEKMSSLGQLVAGVAHEINNPVNFIAGNLSHASRYAQDLMHLVAVYQQHYPDPVSAVQAKMAAIDLEFLLEDLPKLLSSMRVGTDRIQKIVLSLRNFSRMDEAEQKAVDIHEGIDSTLMILQNRLKAKADSPGIAVVKTYGDLPRVECLPGQLNQVFMNILSNAIDALEEQKDRNTPAAIQIQTESLGDRLRIIISDNGSGMTEAQRQRLFDPFFTTKPVGKGTGLGLSISYQIVVNRHGGDLYCHSEPGKGAAFFVEIPIRR